MNCYRSKFESGLHFPSLLKKNYSDNIYESCMIYFTDSIQFTSEKRLPV